MRPLVAVAVAVLAALVVAGPARPARRAGPVITSAGVTGVHLGDRYRPLFRAGKVGAKAAGCELGGPQSVARLKGPVKGGVTLSRSHPQRVIDIQITSGATAGGVGHGDTLADVRAAFPHVKLDHTTDEVFRLTLARVPQRDGGPFEFGLKLHSGRVFTIGVPRILFCD
ncbi:MAG: hypothetical protein QOF76_4591 [Solirubrobacteraceae bacterium]|jgi:hypothetical protein|nr:hypothetical protein [Solirubrobacteraceae bacterium]